MVREFGKQFSSLYFIRLTYILYRFFFLMKSAIRSWSKIDMNFNLILFYFALSACITDNATYHIFFNSIFCLFFFLFMRKRKKIQYSLQYRWIMCCDAVLMRQENEQNKENPLRWKKPVHWLQQKGNILCSVKNVWNTKCQNKEAKRVKSVRKRKEKAFLITVRLDLRVKHRFAASVEYKLEC